MPRVVVFDWCFYVDVQGAQSARQNQLGMAFWATLCQANKRAWLEQVFWHYTLAVFRQVVGSRDLSPRYSKMCQAKEAKAMLARFDAEVKTKPVPSTKFLDVVPPPCRAHNLNTCHVTCNSYMPWTCEVQRCCVDQTHVVLLWHDQPLFSQNPLQSVCMCLPLIWMEMIQIDPPWDFHTPRSVSNRPCMFENNVCTQPECVCPCFRNTKLWFRCSRALLFGWALCFLSWSQDCIESRHPIFIQKCWC